MTLKKKFFVFLALLTAIPCFMQAQMNREKAIELNLIPQPEEVVLGEGFFLLDANAAIISDNEFNGRYFADIVNNSTGLGIKYTSPASKNFKSVAASVGKKIILKIDASCGVPEEGYTIKVTPQEITTVASTAKGSFYSIQTLLQLLPPAIYGKSTGFEQWRIPAVEIKDSPRFRYRGLEMDVSRTFFGLDYVYKFLDWMAYHKLNKFHWHLTDDNGWRIEIKKYPLLTQKGAWRGPNEVTPAAYGSGNKRYGGFYTQKEIREVIKYAAERNIEIIPEIDMPGHSKSVIGCYPEVGCVNETEFISVNGEVKNVWCIGKESNYEMLDNILKEIAALFPSPVIHVGGDEVNMDNWKECPICQAFMKKMGMTKEIELHYYFVKKLEEILAKYGKTMAGWDEILNGGKLRPETNIYAWRNIKMGTESVNTHEQPTIMQIGEYCYLDMKQSPAERGHNWAGIVTLEKTYSLDPIGSLDITPDKEKFVLGIQGAVWAELLNKPVRFSEYQFYPRACAIAEIGWSAQEKREIKDFKNRLQTTHFERLFNMGIAFRVEPPAVTYKDSRLMVTLPYSHAVVRYTTDCTEPDCNSPIYTGDIVTYQPQDFRFATFYKDIYKSITVMADNVAVAEYITPETTIETSFEGSHKNFPQKNITDYNFKTYWRTNRTGVAGDYVAYLFKEAVESSRIVIVTGIPDIDLYGVTDGYVEVMYEGSDWEKAADIIENVAIVKPVGGKKVKGVKICLTDTTDALNVSLQDLRIEK